MSVCVFISAPSEAEVSDTSPTSGKVTLSLRHELSEQPLVTGVWILETRVSGLLSEHLVLSRAAPTWPAFGDIRNLPGASREADGGPGSPVPAM